MTARTFLKSPKSRLFVIGAIPACAAVLEIGLRVGFGFGTPLLNTGESIVSRIQFNRSRDCSANSPARGTLHSIRILVLANTESFERAKFDREQTLGSQLHQALRVNGRPMEVMNAAAARSDISGQVHYLQKFGTWDSRWVVLQIGSEDLLQSEFVQVESSLADHRPLLAITEAWSRYVKPRFFALTASTPTRQLPVQEHFFDNMDSLLHALALIRNAGAKPLILHTPERSEVINPERGDDMYAQWRDSFLDIAMQEQVPTINLAESWRRDPAVASYFNDHVHLTAAGNASVARHLAQFLLSAEHQHFKPGGDDIIVKADFDPKKWTRVTRPSDEMGRPSDQSGALKGGFFSEGRVTRDLPSQKEQPTRKEP